MRKIQKTLFMGIAAALLFMLGSVNSFARVRTSFSGDNSAGHYNGNLSLLRDEASARLTAEGLSSSEQLYTRVDGLARDAYDVRPLRNEGISSSYAWVPLFQGIVAACNYYVDYDWVDELNLTM